MNEQQPFSPLGDPPPATGQHSVERQIRRRTFLSFAVFGLAGAGGLGVWKWFRSLPKNADHLALPTRNALEFNEKVNNLFFSEAHLAPEYPLSEAAPKPRVNGYAGMNRDFKPEEWMLRVEHPRKETLAISLGELKALPKTEIVFDLKCIEGWNQIVHYGGVKFSDFLRHYRLGTRSGGVLPKQPRDWYSYVGLETPDGKYYVGLDMKSVLHPQTILCYELNGQALPPGHGAPLRLIIPTKYGIKNLKRIGRMVFSDARPKDYWHQRGYDYDAAL
ncbi:MAG: molybdopterin-dependent oxidoreductase [Ferruginibacter sp.]|nr:molybdopterin-dependent oxidoreductase [Cytophagales bacterium]